MIPSILTDSNFLLYAIKHYNNPCCTNTEEWADDVRRIKYVKKLITRYVETGELKERLILNHLIVLSNIYQPEPLCRILWLKMENQFSYIKPFLLMIGCLVDYILNVKIEQKIETEDIPMDQGIIVALRKI